MMTSISEKSEWQKLSWKEKVQICQQDIAKEDSLLISYVVIFVGVEAILAAVVLGNILSPSFDKTIAALGILLAVIFALVCKRRSDLVDSWGAILYQLWNELPADEELNRNENLPRLSGKAVIKAKDIAEDCEGCVERLKGGWKVIILGYSPRRKALKFWLKSARRLIIVLCPTLVIVMWALILCRI